MPVGIGKTAPFINSDIHHTSLFTNKVMNSSEDTKETKWDTGYTLAFKLGQFTIWKKRLL